MVKIALVCSGGMSSSFLAKKMQDAVKNKDAIVEYYGQHEIDSIIIQSDLILLAPQIRFLLPKLKENYPNHPIQIIQSLDYGRMNGEKVLNDALEFMKQTK